MATKLPYLASPGLVPRILQKIQEAKRPERFTHDFLETKLGFSGGSARAIIPLLKRMGFLNPDGTPTNLYNQFRNLDTQGYAAAQGIRNAYQELFERNEYANELDKDGLKSLIVEITGASYDDRSLDLTVSTFEKLKAFADFEASPIDRPTAADIQISHQGPSEKPPLDASLNRGQDVGLNIAYTINIVMPETTNPEVVDNIFRSIREKLLGQQ
jgi:hypothetical protein